MAKIYASKLISKPNETLLATKNFAYFSFQATDPERKEIEGRRKRRFDGLNSACSLGYLGIQPGLISTPF
jgi:hypothetical protein